MSTCTVCGVAACGLASHQRIAKLEDEFWQEWALSKQQQDTAAPGPVVARQLADEVKSQASKVAAYRTASSRVLAEELAAKERELNPSLTIERALARVYEAHPGLYQHELSVSDLLHQRQTQVDDEARRFS